MLSNCGLVIENLVPFIYFIFIFLPECCNTASV